MAIVAMTSAPASFGRHCRLIAGAFAQTVCVVSIPVGRPMVLSTYVDIKL
jgi:hypothetical protein